MYHDIWIDIEMNDYHLVKAYFENAGNDIEMRNNVGDTPLIHASWKSSSSLIIHYLIDKGANIEAKNSFGQTPLIVSTRGERILVAEILLEHGADPNSSDTSGLTPLMYASCLNNTEAIRMLLESGAKPELRDNEGETAFYMAVKRRSIAVVELLAKPTVSTASYKGISLSAFVPINCEHIWYGKFVNDEHFLKMANDIVSLYLDRAIRDPQFGMEMERDVSGILNGEVDLGRLTETDIRLLKGLWRKLQSIDYTEGINGKTLSDSDDDQHETGSPYDMEL